jgi:alpha-amylase
MPNSGFTGLDCVLDSPSKSIYRIQNEFADRWDHVIGNELGNYDFLMFCDVETRNPAVRTELQNWGQWLHETTRFSAVRIDAAKHLSPEFVCNWLQKLRSQTEDTIFAVAEYYAHDDQALLERYFKATQGSLSLFDTALHANFHHASQADNEFDLRRIFAGTFVETHPEHAVTFVENHDTQPLQALEAPVQSWFKPLAYALILLRSEGYPCVFYPDLYGAEYRDLDQEECLREIALPKIAELEELLKLRQTHAHGEQSDFFDDASRIGFVRRGNDTQDGCAVVMSNSDGGLCLMEMGTRYAGCQFQDSLHNSSQPVTMDKNGWGQFLCPARSVSVYIPTAGTPY